MSIFVGLKQVLPYLGILDFNHPRGRLISTILRIFIPMSTICIIISGIWFIGYEDESFVDISRAVMGLDLYFEVFFVYLIISITRNVVSDLFSVIEKKIAERKCDWLEEVVVF